MTQVWNFSSLQGVVADLQGSSCRIGELLDQCQESLATLQSSWHGSGNESYSMVQQRFNQNTTDINHALGDLVQAISNSADSMQHTEQGVMSMFSG